MNDEARLESLAKRLGASAAERHGSQGGGTAA